MKYRAELVKRAEVAGNLDREGLEDNLQHNAILSKKVRNRGEAKQEVVEPSKASDFKSESLIDRRKRCRRKGPISLSEKIDITKKVLVDKVIQRDVAREF